MKKLLLSIIAFLGFASTAYAVAPFNSSQLSSSTATPGYLLQTISPGINKWVATSSLGFSGGGTPGGSNTQLQFNNSGSFGGTSGITTNGSGAMYFNNGGGDDGTGAAFQINQNPNLELNNGTLFFSGDSQPAAVPGSARANIGYFQIDSYWPTLGWNAQYDPSVGDTYISTDDQSGCRGIKPMNGGNDGLQFYCATAGHHGEGLVVTEGVTIDPGSRSFYDSINNYWSLGASSNLDSGNITTNGSGNITAKAFVTSGGTSAQYVKGDGTLGTYTGTNFFSNSGASTTLSTGSNLLAGIGTFGSLIATGTLRVIGQTTLATASSTGLTVTATSTLTGERLTNLSSTFLAVDANGNVIATTTPSGGSGNNAILIGNKYVYTATSTDSFGVGTSSLPAAKLAVVGTYGSTTPLFDVSSTTSSAGATSSLMKIFSDGNVSIGSGSEAAKLYVAGGALLLDNNQTINFNNTGSSGSGAISMDAGNNWKFNNGIAFSSDNVLLNGGNFNIQTLHNTGNAFSVLDNGGAIVAANLSVGGALTVSTTTATSSFAGSVTFGSTTQPLIFGVFGANAGFGTTTPSQQVTIASSTGTSTLFITSTSGTQGGQIIMKDTNGTTCTRLTTLSGVLTATAVTCP